MTCVLKNMMMLNRTTAFACFLFFYENANVPHFVLI